MTMMMEKVGLVWGRYYWIVAQSFAWGVFVVGCWHIASSSKSPVEGSRARTTYMELDRDETWSMLVVASNFKMQEIASRKGLLTTSASGLTESSELLAIFARYQCLVRCHLDFCVEMLRGL
ncbi:hypothetical protein HDV57DRAFT_497474 [Trichoderma longibrachiatum]